MAAVGEEAAGRAWEEEEAEAAVVGAAQALVLGVEVEEEVVVEGEEGRNFHCGFVY